MENKLETIAPRSAQILVVEDDYDEASGLRSVLEDWGHTVPAVVSTAEKALQEAGQHTLDLALVDIRLPGNTDGIGLAEALLERWRVPAVFVSAYTDAETLARAGAACPRGFVSKPFSRETLRSTVEVALGHGGPPSNRFRAGGPPWENLGGLATLCGGVSHQLNNLLTVVMGSAALLRERFKQDATAYSRLEQIEEAARSAGNVTQQMLVFSQDSAFSPQSLDVDLVAAECAQLFADSGLEVHLDLHGAHVQIEADRDLVRLICINLLRNAAEALGGGGAVRLRTEEAFLPPDARHREGRAGIGITVSENGPGMSASVRTRAFEPFFSTKGPGRGLGLAAVHGAVARHGGLAFIESSPGHGTAVYVWLPLKPPEPDDPPAETTGASPGRKTVLVVDDEPMVLRTLELLLNGLGYRVLTATNGREALDAATESCDEIDVVVLDMVMPVMTGSEALPHLRKLCPDAPILVLTGYNHDQVLECGQEKDIFKILKKPIRRADLDAALREALAAVR